MQALIAIVIRVLGWALPGLGWKLLKGLGFTAISYVGVKYGMEQALNLIWSQFGKLPAEWLNILGLLQIDVYFNILFSAYLARAALWGMNKSGNKTSYRMGGQ